MPGPITPCIWSDHRAKEQAAYYCDIFPDSRILHVSHVTEEVAAASGASVGDILMVEMELNGQPFTVLNGVTAQPFNESVSMQVVCKDQAEVDHFWNAFGAEGETNVCGWVADKYGLKWQVFPQVHLDILRGDDEAAKQRALTAMLAMTKFDVAAIEAARG